MKALSAEEMTDLLGKIGQTEDPHRAEDLPSVVQHMQFYAPDAYGTVESFVRSFIEEVVVDGNLIFQLDDWSPWDETHVYIIKSLWPEFDETKSQGLGGGLLFPKAEHGKAAAFFGLTAAFGWKSYLYGEDEHLCLYNWEGEIFDAWTASGQKMGLIKELIERNKFELVPYEED